MLTLLSRFFLLLSAFAPLFFIWALRALPGWIAWVFIGFVVVGVLGTALVVMAAQRDEGEPARITDVQDRQSDIAAYLVTYLIPFVTAPLSSLLDVIAIAVFLLLLIALYFTSDLMSVNPLLALFGLRLYQVELDGARKVWLLARRPRANTQTTVARFIGSSVYIEIGSA